MLLERLEFIHCIYLAFETLIVYKYGCKLFNYIDVNNFLREIL